MLRRNFSLIELLIVIGIMGALAALILPSFNNVEADAKDTACDYNQAGTLRYLTLFRSANGVYPTGFHTGYEVKNGSQLLQLADASGSALTACGTYNFGTASTATALDESTLASLQGAGIVSLAYGRGIAEEIAATTHYVAVVKAGTERVANSFWTEDLNPVTGEVDSSKDAAPLKYHNAPLYLIAQVGTYDKAAEVAATEDAEVKAANNCRKTVISDGKVVWDEGPFKIVPLYVAPTVDWEHYYSDGPNDSKISIALAGKCPWGEGGQARYYIAFFKVYTEGGADAEPAKLLCTSCPDCGILNDDMF